ncbi:MAG TPA: TlpA disulfide reductase family protein [Acidimicrobiales bacterium]|nr:TlpA disulfide reductase family protein [Acidimicrobiales bacterium]
MRIRSCFVVALLAVAAACGGSGAGGRAGGPLDATFKRFDGTTGTFAQYRGKPLVVNFFSSTCIPCQTEMPALEKVHKTLGDQVVFLGIDVQDTTDGGKAFIDTVGITWELGRDPAAALLQDQLKATKLPTTALIDRSGRVVLVHEGPLDVGGLTGQLRDHHLIS